MKKSSLFVLASLFVASFLVAWCSHKTTPTNEIPTDTQNTVTAPTADETTSGTDTTVASTKQANLETSTVKWLAKKIGGEHYGTVKLKSGSLNYNTDNKLVGGSFVLDMTTITDDDLQWEMQAKLLQHLQSDDFFSVATHPTSTLTITSVKELSPTNLEISWDLTIKGITNPVMFVATTDGAKFTAPIVIDRTLRDIKYNSLKFFSDIADKAIEDTITFEVTLNIQA